MAIGKHSTPSDKIGYATLAIALQEAASADLSNSDVARRVSDAVRAAHQASGSWAYYIDHFGDPDCGDVIFSSGGMTRKAPYSVAAGGDGSTAQTYAIDMDSAEDVYPRTIYETMPDEDEHYSAMQESYKADGIYLGDLPVYERFISKKERDSADEADFAGKGKSFPILKPADVAAAAHALGRAGSNNLSISTIKSRIIAIAKKKGWERYRPKAWQGASPAATDAKESAVGEDSGELLLIESAACVYDRIELSEADAAKSDYEIKLIAPGKGSTAYYPADVLKRDGPKVFKEGTKVFLNHQTVKEEAERPEGDVNSLAGVLTTDAVWKESAPKGPGLYASMKVFADHASTVAEKAKHVGMSIRAYGTQAISEGKRLMREGVPVLGSFIAPKSVDIVARAGAGGLILTESAKADKMAKAKKKTGKADCPKCEGSGDCASCGGSGKSVKESSAKSETDCTDCLGSGDCATCEGSGMLKESAPRASIQTNQENEMDEKAVRELVESAVQSALAPAVQAALAPVVTELREAKAQNASVLDRNFKADARDVAREALKGVALRESAKSYIVEQSLKTLPVKDGALDVTTYKESLATMAKELAGAIGSDGATVTGMGTAVVPPLDPREAERQAAEVKDLRESSIDVFSRLMGGDTKAATAAANKGVAA